METIFLHGNRCPCRIKVLDSQVKIWLKSFVIPSRRGSREKIEGGFICRPIQ